MLRHQPRGNAPAQKERRDHAQDRDDGRRGPDLQHRADAGFEPHLEQQDQHAQARRACRSRRRFLIASKPSKPRKSQIAEEHAENQLRRAPTAARCGSPGRPRAWPRPESRRAPGPPLLRDRRELRPPRRSRSRRRPSIVLDPPRTFRDALRPAHDRTPRGRFDSRRAR